MEKIVTHEHKIFPTHEHRHFKIRHGFHQPFGATIVPGGINFSVFSHHAQNCTLWLYRKGEDRPLVEIPFQGFFFNLALQTMTWVDFRIGKVFNMIVFDLNPEEIEYGFSFEGPANKLEGPVIHRYDPFKLLLDPYAKSIGGRDVWGELDSKPPTFLHRGRIIQEDYDWESDRQLEIPMAKLIIYEMHVRGFTRHPSSQVTHPGTYQAIKEKIPYLKELGINCIELMPIAEFDEFENARFDAKTGEPLLNYWGYSPLGFFAPKAGYAACGKFQDGTLVADELKSLVRELHKNGIEVILDVVFNHTAEGNEQGPTISLKGIDNSTYYILSPDGQYLNFSGTGNTVNCNNPIVRNVLLDCLRYWVAEYHIDGFRFDLASILGRDPSGVPLANPPLLESLSYDPVLAKCKLIAESWDAAGLYQVGSFPAYGRWAEWNGRFRDVIRRFVKGDLGQVRSASDCILGSQHLYRTYQKTASVNFVTCHDGFTLWDLVSYNHKHNEDNDEDNRDGINENYSWNCGVEGESDDEGIKALRLQQIKNFILLLFVSQGVPMIAMGDEMGRSQGGNNNAYCQDSAPFWLNWDLLESNAEIFRFMKASIALRKCYPVLASGEHSFITWYSEWEDEARQLAFMVSEVEALPERPQRMLPKIYVALNMDRCTQYFKLPALEKSKSWHVFANTGMCSPEDVWPDNEPLVEPQDHFLLKAHSACLLVCKSLEEAGNLSS